MGFDAASSRLLLFGGRTRAGGLVSVLGDTWSWDGSSWSQVSAPALRDAEPVGMARDARDQQLLLVTRRPIGPGPFQTWTWTGSAWRLAVPFAPSIRLVASDPASGSVLALAIDLQTGGWATWLWNGRTWIVHQPAAPPFVEEFSPVLASDPAHGDTVLVEQPFLAEDGSQQGGTLVWNGSTWVSYPNAVPDRLLNLFDKTQPVLSQGPGGRLLMVGGDRGDDSYRRVWTWDGTTWRRIS